MAHDPKNAIRILAWRTSDGTIALQPEANGVLQNLIVLTEHQAYDTPSVACGAASIAKNCIVVWATPATDGRFHNLRWFHFAVSQSGGVFSVPMANRGSVYTLGYIMFGAPQVAYVGPATSSSAFVVTWKNPECNFYSLRKTASENSVFGDEHGHYGGACNHSSGAPAVGSVSSFAELINVWF
jgi:hypothetical protein